MVAAAGFEPEVFEDAVDGCERPKAFPEFGMFEVNPDGFVQHGFLGVVGRQGEPTASIYTYHIN